MTPTPSLIRHPRRVLAAAAALGLAAEVLFDGEPLGLSFPLLVAGFLASLAVLAGREGLHGARRVALLALPMLALACFVAVRASPDLVVLNVLGCLVLAGILVHGFCGAFAVADLKLWDLVMRPIEGWVGGLRTAPAAFRQGVDGARAAAVVKAHGGTIVRAVLITAPVVLIFTTLLSMGDARFADAVGGVLATFAPGDGGALAATFWTAAGTFVAAGLLTHALRRRTWAPLQTSAEEKPKPLGPAEGLSVVGALVALFTAFAAVQGRSFFVERAKLIPSEPGIGWGTYTREGFVQLMVASGLTLGLLVALPAITRLEAGARRSFQLGSTVLVGLTLIILGTGANRLVAYEEAYGFSVMRVYGHVFAFALGGVLIWRAVTLWISTHRFAVGALAAALAWLLALNVLDPERFVVEKNLARYDASGELDLEYLLSLSPDALPALRRGIATRTTLEDKLELVCSSRRDVEEKGWQALNLARSRARALPKPCLQ